jgi:RNA polymerase sigma factor (TIGR02999 family)
LSEVTQIIAAAQNGDPNAASELLPIVYEELRRLAAQRLSQERPGQTLTATALVHEAYLRLVGVENSQIWQNRGHFFAAAAEAMRRILINRARDKKRLKRGGNRERIDLEHIQVALDTEDAELIALDESLEKLAAEDDVAAQLVKLRFFAGLNMRDAAQALGIAQRTAERQWSYARAWLYHELRGSP